MFVVVMNTYSLFYFVSRSNTQTKTIAAQTEKEKARLQRREIFLRESIRAREVAHAAKVKAQLQQIKHNRRALKQQKRFLEMTSRPLAKN